MDHRAVLSQLPDTLRTHLTERSDVAGLRQLSLHLGGLAITGCYIGFQLPLWPVLLLPHGIGLVFLFTLSHECTHQTPFRTRLLNDLAGHGAAVVLGLPFIWFRYFHFAHHRYTNDPARDPELANGGAPTSRRDWLIYLSGWTYWTGMARVIWDNARGKLTADYLPVRRHPAMIREARVLLAIYLGALASLLISPLLFWIWFLPLVIGQPFLRAYLLAEHGCAPRWRTCWKIRVQRSPRAQFGIWPGTCPTMLNITAFRLCPFITCLTCTKPWLRT